MLDVVSVVLFSFVALLVWLWRWERSSFVRQIDRIPGPPKVPFFGNVFDVPRNGSGKLTLKGIRPQGDFLSARPL